MIGPSSPFSPIKEEIIKEYFPGTGPGSREEALLHLPWYPEDFLEREPAQAILQFQAMLAALPITHVRRLLNLKPYLLTPADVVHARTSRYWPVEAALLLRRIFLERREKEAGGPKVVVGASDGVPFKPDDHDVLLYDFIPRGPGVREQTSHDVLDGVVPGSVIAFGCSAALHNSVDLLDFMALAAFTLQPGGLLCCMDFEGGGIGAAILRRELVPLMEANSHLFVDISCEVCDVEIQPLDGTLKARLEDEGTSSRKIVVLKATRSQVPLDEGMTHDELKAFIIDRRIPKVVFFNPPNEGKGVEDASKLCGGLQLAVQLSGDRSRLQVVESLAEICCYMISGSRHDGDCATLQEGPGGKETPMEMENTGQPLVLSYVGSSLNKETRRKEHEKGPPTGSSKISLMADEVQRLAGSSTTVPLYMHTLLSLEKIPVEWLVVLLGGVNSDGVVRTSQAMVDLLLRLLEAEFIRRCGQALLYNGGDPVTSGYGPSTAPKSRGQYTG